MRLSRLLVAAAAAFSASALAVAPPGFGPQQGSQPSPNAEERNQQGMRPGASSSEREGNAWLSSTLSDAWQASAQSESRSTKEPERSATYGEPPLPSGADKASAPQLVPERRPAIGEQS